jgi:hypothetical protein
VVRHEGEGTPGGIDVDLVDGWIDREGALHRRVVLRLPRGSDEEHVAALVEREPDRARDALLLRCIAVFGSLPRAALEAYGMKILRELTLADRRLLFEAIDARAPGVRFRRHVECAACGTRFEAPLRPQSFFGLG